jgi:membrane-associated protease RseP (regulator of RpoE activity)
MVLGSHEMGHYVAARLNRVSSSLPHFLPFPPHYGLVPFGTLGAVIRIRGEVSSRAALFDIGVSGPIAGFCVSLVILCIGFATLPPIDFLYTVHPEYRTLQSLPTTGLTFGTNLAFEGVRLALARDATFVPPMNEIYHYPFLCVGWFGLFITSLNLIPIGQLDGGHVIAAMFPQSARLVANIAFSILILLAALGVLEFFGGPSHLGWIGWGVWAIILFMFERFTIRGGNRLLLEGQGLTGGRQKAFYFCLACFVVSFTPVPFAL